MIYCGNNRRSRKLTSGRYRIGDRLSCLRKGVYIGENQPYDEEYAGDFEPITNRKLFCGNSNMLPEDYDDFGSNSECLRIGVGVGKRKKASQTNRRSGLRRKRSKRRSKSKKRSIKRSRKRR